VAGIRVGFGGGSHRGRENVCHVRLVNSAKIFRNANAPSNVVLTLAMPCSESVGIPRFRGIDDGPVAAKRHKARRIRCRAASMRKKLQMNLKRTFLSAF
jgi:hypothetical protein